MKNFLISLIPNRLVWQISKPYVAGDSMQKVIEKVKDLWTDNNFSSTVDLLGEDVFSQEEIEAMVQIYLELIKQLEPLKTDRTISLKPSALGVNSSKALCLANLRKILTAAKEANIGVTMDMEDSSLTEITLDMYRELCPQFPNFGTVLQTRLFRTNQDIKNLPDHSHIRLCIGIYLESKEIALTHKPDMKQKIIDYLDALLENGHYVGIATHDEQTIQETLDLLEAKKIGSERVEYQFLLGVPRNKIQNKLREKGYTVRFYVPFATHWTFATAYAKRRFIENPKLAIYTMRNLLGYRKIQFLIFVLLLLGITLLLFFSGLFSL